MTTKEANAIVAKYNSKKKHTMGEKMKFIKAQSFLRNQKLKIQ